MSSRNDIAYGLIVFGYIIFELIIFVKSFSDFMSKGIFPVIISYPRIPIDHKSTFSSYEFPLNSYGDTYKGVPQNV